MSTKEKRIKFIPATAINIIAEINELLIENARNKTDSEIELPGLIDRAFLIYHEAGVLPMTDTLEQVGE